MPTGLAVGLALVLRYATIRWRFAPERPWFPRFPTLSREFGAAEAIRIGGRAVVLECAGRTVIPGCSRPCAGGHDVWMESLIHLDPRELSVQVVDAGPPR
jgi:hypothetical protein